MYCRNMKYALSGFFGAFGSLMLPLRDFPAFRCAARNAFSRLMSSGVRVRFQAATSRSRCSFAACDRRLNGYKWIRSEVSALFQSKTLRTRREI